MADAYAKVLSELDDAMVNCFTAELEASKVSELEAENDRLKAEVERLTKAGNELYDAWIGYHGEQILDNYNHGTGEICRAWNAAKEGKQP
jgi:hypothetical protein